MNEGNETNAVLDPAVTAKVAAHYRHARKKHPRFVDKMFVKEEEPSFVKDADSRLSIWRAISCLGKTDAESVLLCELAEARDAYAQGDRAAAVEEFYDAVAVLLRMIDVLEGRQALGDPAKEDAKTKGEMR